MHTFQVGKHYLAVEDVPMFTASVFDHSIRDSFLVFPSELGSATRTLLSEEHRGKSKKETRPGCTNARSANAALQIRNDVSDDE
jgi:hypothetical protein